MWKCSSYTPIRELMKDELSAVWLAQETEGKRRKVTIKMIRFRQLAKGRYPYFVRNEQKCLEMLRREISHTNLKNFYRYPASALRVPHLLETFQEQCDVSEDSLSHFMKLDKTESLVFFVYLFIPGATLNKHIAKKTLSEETVKFFAAEIVNILGALHERGFIYRDLKASNIVIEPTGRLTLIDFGFSKYIGLRGRTKSICGTLHAMAPEIFVCEQMKRDQSEKDLRLLIKNSCFSTIETTPKTGTTPYTTPMKNSPSSPLLGTSNYGAAFGHLVNDSYGFEADWWSLGILIYEMIYSVPPFGYYSAPSLATENEKKEYMKKLVLKSPDNVTFPTVPKISEELKELLLSLLQADCSKRIGFSFDAREIEKASWFKNFDWKALHDRTKAGPEVCQFSEINY